MIDLGTLAGLHAHRHELHAYCLRCDRWATLDLARMITCGQGARRLPVKVRCQVCGAPGELQVRPPMPRWGNSNGWPAPVQTRGKPPGRSAGISE